MSAPKKIWFDREECSAGPVKFNDDEIPYIRADIVDELVEALKEIAEWTERYTTPGHPISTVARAALAKLEESHD